MAEGCRFRSVIPNGEAGEIAVLRAFEPKADPSPPLGMLRDRFVRSGRQANAKSRSFGLKASLRTTNPSKPGVEGIPVLAIASFTDIE